MSDNFVNIAKQVPNSKFAVCRKGNLKISLLYWDIRRKHANKLQNWVRLRHIIVLY